jgi:hypothetical protein
MAGPQLGVKKRAAGPRRGQKSRLNMYGWVSVTTITARCPWRLHPFGWKLPRRPELPGQARSHVERAATGFETQAGKQ